MDAKQLKHPALAPGSEPFSSQPVPTPEQVCQQYYGRVYNVARKMLNDPADAEDAAQDVLLQVMRKLSSYRGEAALPTWLHQVTVNTVLSHRRKRALRGRVPLRDARNGFESETDQSNAFRRSSQGPEDEVLGREKRKLIDRAITQLPKAYREVFHLADVEGLPNQEIGERLGLSLPAVKSRLRRARRLMRDRLAPHFEEISA